MSNPNGCLRIELNLKELFNDHRQRAYVAMNGKWTHVSHLQQRIRKLFKIQKKICLVTEDNILLPELDRIAVVRPGDTLVVKLLDKSPEPGRSIAEDIEDVVPVKLEDIAKEAVAEATAVVANGECSTGSTRPKRIRKRKRKVNIAEPQPLAKKPTQIIAEVAPTVVSSNGHIRFDEDEGEAIVPDPGGSARTDIVRDVVMAEDHSEDIAPLPPTARVISASCTDLDIAPSDIKALLRIDSTNSFKDNNLIVDESEPPTRKLDVNIFKPNTNNIINNNDEAALEFVRKNVSTLNLKPLDSTVPLQQNEIVAFRITKSEKLSEFLIGMIQEVSVDKNFVEVFILAGQQVVEQFENKPIAENNILRMRLDQMIERKRVKLN